MSSRSKNNKRNKFTPRTGNNKKGPGRIPVHRIGKKRL